jgi:hypothetical protein|tara:strand:- start:667 stop:777 length:111 start_codon:yes stop_codon:yes gene_type:complete
MGRRVTNATNGLRLKKWAEAHLAEDHGERGIAEAIA